MNKQCLTEEDMREYITEQARMGGDMEKVKQNLKEMGRCAQEDSINILTKNIEKVIRMQEKQELNQEKIIERLNEGSKEMIKIRGLIRERELINGQIKDEVGHLKDSAKESVDKDDLSAMNKIVAESIGILRDEVKFIQRTVIVGVLLIVAAEILKGLLSG